jgi:hypothetical protein
MGMDWGSTKGTIMSTLPAVTDQDFASEILKAPAAIVDFWGHG